MTDGEGASRPGRLPMYNWDAIPEHDLGIGVVIKGFRTADACVGYNFIHPGAQITTPHSHAMDQIFMLLQGRLKLHIGDQLYECGPGTVMRIPAHAEHWAEPPSEADGVAINLDVFSPARPDYVRYTSYQSEQFEMDLGGKP